MVQGFRALLTQIVRADQAGAWAPALISALQIPDICGAVDNVGIAIAPRDRWKNWYNSRVANNYSMDHPDEDRNMLDGDAMYKVRNSLIHEAVGFARGIDGFDRIAFFPPNVFMMDRIGTGTAASNGNPATLTVSLSLRTFIGAVLTGAASWIAEVEGEQIPDRRQRLDRLIQIRPNGLDGVIIGSAIIA